MAPGPTPHGAEGALNTAIVANFAILISKLCVFMASGSSSILAEAVHSVVDIANQALLRTGLARSVKQPDASYNYGYRREVFVWSLISGVGIFCLGAGVSIVHGVHGLMHPNPVIEHLGASLAVLFISFVIESYSLSVAYRALAEGAKLAGMPVKQYVKLGIDPTSTSVVCEDGAAVLGLVVAAGCLMITKVTGNAAYDAVGSIVVGTLLGAVAVFLIQTNRKALIGRSLSPQKARVTQHQALTTTAKQRYHHVLRARASAQQYENVRLTPALLCRCSYPLRLSRSSRRCGPTRSSSTSSTPRARRSGRACTASKRRWSSTALRCVLSTHNIEVTAKHLISAAVRCATER